MSEQIQADASHREASFKNKMLETVDEETLEWAQRASKEFAKRMDALRQSVRKHNDRTEERERIPCEKEHLPAR